MAREGRNREKNMEEYEKIVAEAQELAAENQRKIDILLADMTRQELRNTSTDAAALARMERDLIDLVNGSRIKRARDRGILRTAAVMPRGRNRPRNRRRHGLGK